jgi:hypothetical protein
MSQPKPRHSHILTHLCCARAFQESFNACLGAPIYGQSLVDPGSLQGSHSPQGFVALHKVSYDFPFNISLA